jgi:Heavy metal associated domain 2
MVSSRRWTDKTNKVTSRITLPIEVFKGNSDQAKALQNRIERLEGIEKAYVSPTTEMVYIIYDAQVIDLETIRQKLEMLETELT